MDESTRKQETSSLAQLKKLKEETKRPLPNDLDLPEPEFRQVAGDVRRRLNRTVEAEPPPPPAPPNRPSAQHQRSNRRRRRLNNGNNEGEESDSDDDNPRRSHGESTASTAKRRPTKQLSPEPPAPPKTDVTSLTPEEQERIDRRRMLENDEVEWQKAMEKFRPLDDNTQLCKRLLWLENKDKPTSNGDKAKRHRNSTIIKLQQNRMNEFLYEALGHETATREGAGDIESAKASYSKGDLMQGIVERIELDFILRWEKRARLPNVLEECPNSEHPHTSALLLQVVDRCYEDYRHVDLNRGIKHLRCTPWLAPDSRPSISSNNPFPDDNYGSLAMDYEQAIFPMPAEQRKSLLLSSRTCKDGRLSSEYVEWVCSQVPDSKIESALRSRRHETYFEIKGRENSSLQTNQFFCDDTKYRRGVMLVYSEENSTPS